MFSIFKKKVKPIGVRTVELSQSLRSLDDVTEFAMVKVFVKRNDRILGNIDINNHYQPISVARLQQEIASNLTLKILEPDKSLNDDTVWNNVMAGLVEYFQPNQGKSVPEPWLVDLSQPLRPLNDVVEFEYVKIMVAWKGNFLGNVDIYNQYQPISITRLRETIAENIGLRLLRHGQNFGKDAMWAITTEALAHHYLPETTANEQIPERLPADVSVSIILATLDRPADLRECLRSLVAQESPRRIEIVVIDNNPDSKLTPPVVAEFPNVILVNERRQGLAYARNAGFVACTGDIAIATDDDVIMPPDWVERLVAPFARSDVMVVTGNVLPLELQTPAQQFFELYGGLGRGFKQFEVNGDWFESFRFFSVPTWELGATANAAFRTSIFNHPKIGLMDESLGPGMPSGVGEDTYVFYKVLKAGYTIVYEPEAYVWHKHRRTMAALRRQLYNYSKGGVGYHLTLFLKDGDLRGLVRIFVELPRNYLWRINERLRGRSDYPLALLLLEIWGNLMGFWALWKSWRRVKREGRSQPYVPVLRQQRHPEMPQPDTPGENLKNLDVAWQVSILTTEEEDERFYNYTGSQCSRNSC